jgi:hypothetical protein
MDYSLIQAALLVVAIVLFYAVIARGLFNFSEPFRWKALEIGETLIANAQVSDERRVGIYVTLGEVYSRWHAWRLLGLLLVVVSTLPFQGVDEPAAGEGIPNHLKSDWARFNLYCMISTVANEPAAAFLFSLLAIFLLAFFASISAISMALSLARGHHHRHNGTPQHS